MGSIASGHQCTQCPPLRTILSTRPCRSLHASYTSNLQQFADSHSNLTTMRAINVVCARGVRMWVPYKMERIYSDRYSPSRYGHSTYAPLAFLPLCVWGRFMCCVRHCMCVCAYVCLRVFVCVCVCAHPLPASICSHSTSGASLLKAAYGGLFAPTHRIASHRTRMSAPTYAIPYARITALEL